MFFNISVCGDIDSDTKWRLDQIVAHEVGHAIGIGHINNYKAIMSPIYCKNQMQMTESDARSAQILYGATDDYNFTDILIPENDNQLCFNSRFDSITQIADGSILIFSK